MSYQLLPGNVLGLAGRSVHWRKRHCVPLQFRSISNALYGSERHHSLVRDTVVRYMAANKAEFEPYLGEDWCVTRAGSKPACCVWADCSREGCSRQAAVEHNPCCHVAGLMTVSCTIDRRRYIKDMAAEGTWGDELTLVRGLKRQRHCHAHVSAMLPWQTGVWLVWFDILISCVQRACCDAYGIMVSVVTSDEAHWYSC